MNEVESLNKWQARYEHQFGCVTCVLQAMYEVRWQAESIHKLRSSVCYGEGEYWSSLSRTNRTGSDTPVSWVPYFKPVSCEKSAWQDLTGLEFSAAIDDVYIQIVHWRKNLFELPSGASGKRFVAELARIFQAFAMELTFEAFAIKAAMTKPALIL